MPKEKYGFEVQYCQHDIEAAVKEYGTSVFFTALHGVFCERMIIDEDVNHIPRETLVETRKCLDKLLELSNSTRKAKVKYAREEDKITKHS